MATKKENLYRIYSKEEINNLNQKYINRKRYIDTFLALLGLIILSPVFLITVSSQQFINEEQYLLNNY